MNILQKEHFNRWYSLKMFYTSVTIIDIPVAVVCCAAFSGIIYIMSAQPMEWSRFSMFFAISLLVVFTAQSFGLVIGAVFSVVVSGKYKFLFAIEINCTNDLSSIAS
uniref:ABCG4_10 protein n=1 Tax=Fopius arisanus TaxID=64838 RepID=A0A0C9RVX2_9HYME